jgi:hypothetical protein
MPVAAPLRSSLPALCQLTDGTPGHGGWLSRFPGRRHTASQEALRPVVGAARPTTRLCARSVLVVVATVGCVTVVAVHVVDVVPVFDRFVPAVGTMDVVMGCRDDMHVVQVALINVVVVVGVRVAVVEVVDVVAVLDRHVPTVGAMRVAVVLVDGVGGAHARSLHWVTGAAPTRDKRPVAVEPIVSYIYRDVKMYRAGQLKMGTPTHTAPVRESESQTSLACRTASSTMWATWSSTRW